MPDPRLTAYGDRFRILYGSSWLRYQQMWRQLQAMALSSLYEYEWREGAFSEVLRRGRDALRRFRSLLEIDMESDSRFLTLGYTLGQEATRLAGHVPSSYMPTSWPLEIPEEWRGYMDRAERRAATRLLTIQEGGRPGASERGQVAMLKASQHLIGVSRDWNRDQAWQGTQLASASPYYLRNATLDLKTCIACLLASGTVYTEEQAMGWRDHPHGRCYLIPVWVGAPEVNGLAYFMALSDAQQQQVLGREYWQAWKEGRITLESLVETVAGYVIQKSLKKALEEGTEGEEGL